MFSTEKKKKKFKKALDSLKKMLSDEDKEKVDQGDLLPILKSLKKSMGDAEFKKIKDTFEEFIKLARKKG